MKVVKSIVWGYAGAILAGLIVGFIGIAFGLSEKTVAAAAVPTGVVFGMFGLSLVWRRLCSALASQIPPCRAPLALFAW